MCCIPGVEPAELIRRFLQHILPKGFTRVRAFGWFHPASKIKLNRVRALLRQKPLLSQAEQEAWLGSDPSLDPEAPALELESDSMALCPRCRVPMRWRAAWRAGETPPSLAPRGPPSKPP